MAGETTVVNPRENSPEQVGFKLLRIVAAFEVKHTSMSPQEGPNAYRQYIIETYIKRLFVVRGQRP